MDRCSYACWRWECWGNLKVFELGNDMFEDRLHKDETGFMVFVARGLSFTRKGEVWSEAVCGVRRGKTRVQGWPADIVMALVEAGSAPGD